MPSGDDDCDLRSNLDDWVGESVETRGETRALAFPNLRAAFRTAVEQFGPNDFFVSVPSSPPTPSTCLPQQCRASHSAPML